MPHLLSLRCVSCRRDYRPDELEYTCPACGPRRGTLEVLYDLDAVGEELTPQKLAEDPTPSMWRYFPILPLERRGRGRIQPLRIGWTPLYRFDRLAREYGVEALYVKDDGANPTASYKDRASSLVVIKAQEKSFKEVTCASTGNAASSLAGYAAAASLECIIFVPADAQEAKVAQLLVYGARVFLVEGSYDEAFDLCTQAAEAFGWYNRSAGVNPYLVEGKKTGAWELAEQLSWKVPDYVLVPVGDGSVVSGVCKGFFEMAKLGLIERLPRVIGVQAEGASPLARAFQRWREGEDEDREPSIEDIEAHTVAEGIAVGRPRDGFKALKYVRKTRGEFVTVSDEEILAALRTLARRTGVFAEPAGAAGFAGFLKLAERGRFKPSERVALLVTGHGLKDIASARRVGGRPHRIGCDLDRVREVLRGTGEDH